jgi:hypothetical protein
VRPEDNGEEGKGSRPYEGLLPYLGPLSALSGQHQEPIGNPFRLLAVSLGRFNIAEDDHQQVAEVCAIRR